MWEGDSADAAALARAMVLRGCDAETPDRSRNDYRRTNMPRGNYPRVLLSLAGAGAMLFACTHVSLAGEFCLDCWRCPPPYVHCQEGPPRLRFRCVCPRPVCGPCDLKHYGYYPTCWSPFPWPPDYSCCPAPMVPGVTPPGIAPGAVGSVSKLPEPEFNQPLGRSLGQTSP